MGRFNISSVLKSRLMWRVFPGSSTWLAYYGFPILTPTHHFTGNRLSIIAELIREIDLGIVNLYYNDRARPSYSQWRSFKWILQILSASSKWVDEGK